MFIRRKEIKYLYVLDSHKLKIFCCRQLLFVYSFEIKLKKISYDDMNILIRSIQGAESAVEMEDFSER